MKNMRIRLVIGSLIALVAAAPSRGETPLGTGFTYQGQLKQGGAPFEGTADFQFTLWDAVGSGNPPVGGAQVGGVQAINALPVTAGLFTVTLNGNGAFGGNAFKGNARWLQVQVRSPAGGGGFTTLAPRQPMSATPYALFALSSPGSVSGSGTTNFIPFWSAPTTLVNSLISQDNGVVRLPNLVGLAAGGTGGQVSFGAPNGETGMLISGTSRADIRFNGSTLRLAAGPAGSPPFGGIGIETTGIVRLPSIVTMEPIGTGGQVSFAGPNGETGMTIAGASGRADLRFDGSNLKLVNGPAGVPPPATNGIAINTSGNVGIGTTAPNSKLDVAGNVTQGAAYSGLVKAMALVKDDNTVVQCFNSHATGAAINTPPCNINVTFEAAGNYLLDFGFPVTVNTRFISVTPRALTDAGTAPIDVTATVGGAPINQTRVFMRSATQGARSGFFIIIY